MLSAWLKPRDWRSDAERVVWCRLRVGSSAALVTVSITAADQLVEAFIDANLGS
jgi:hypothetical protein